ncbi:retropepsin-like aspartic protease [Massilia horti]|nr:retropepsin-like aspartic protease [Massilia horti]
MLNGRKLAALVDTGVHHTTVTLAAAKRAGFTVDAPGVKRLEDIRVVGTNRRVAHWSAPIDTFSIGSETIRGGEIDVIDSEGWDGIDVRLGQDFLRTHRLLFAMGQRKLYLAYLGGDVFNRRNGLEPRIPQQAQAPKTAAR